MHPVLFQIGSLMVPSYGACAAVGVLLALALAPFTARKVGLDPRHAWNMLVLAVFASVALSRLVLIAINLGDLRRHPRWLLALAMVHHPLLAAIGIAGGAAAVAIYARWAKLSLRVVADCSAAPVALGMAFEQLGALMAGSDFGREATSGFTVTYTNELAARWSGTPLGVELYPVQAYAALGALLLMLLCLLFPSRRQGDLAAIWLLGTGILLFLTEILRDWEGRGVFFAGAGHVGTMDIPQLVGLGMVVLSGIVLFDWRNSTR
jgi:phosphatidylglycerol---prolipoprotein diacylglyceryl transferase